MEPSVHELGSSSDVKDTPVVLSSRDPAGEHVSLLRYAAFALGFALFLRFFIAAPYVVSGASMEPNFDNWDYLLTDRITYDFQKPQRGDVVIFCLPGGAECSLWKRLAAGQFVAPRSLIKRVIGLPGETVTVDGAGVRIRNAEHPEGFYLDEPYLAAENLGGPTGLTITLGAAEYFVLGDNRRVSSDSRYWGPLPETNIVGRVLVRLFPFSNIDLFPAESRYSS